ncbi:YhcN/YlaJ family sporulation lipoprotein [Pseudalkalibacillus berkeleyi]|uniref:YhcN/YlaJ family sporulation lipoprotein n=1 Tax=Pseudalkalibacillus berkeleyi TaxID=1069813 RepID=A0ABS9H086_9BACL|nr:YhcN/YlaJ family sporulation lipoprotein [Pseudalkalibacillus berkeleyi]MCF6137197.1 YhcN/YlaJ family sporulation lipoprotein [Pseudalkalibacillus berkeleyi]
MFKKITTILIVFLILVACNGMNGEEGQRHYSNPTEQDFKINKNNIEDAPIVKRTSAESANAKELVKLTEQVKGVKSARAIVSGIYIVVGVELEQNVDEEKTVNQIYRQLSSHSKGANALVTTNAEHLATMQEWGKAINKNKITEELDIYNGLGVMISKIKPNENLEIRKSNPSKEYLDQHRLPDVKK